VLIHTEIGNPRDSDNHPGFGLVPPVFLQLKSKVLSVELNGFSQILDPHVDVVYPLDTDHDRFSPNVPGFFDHKPKVRYPLSLLEVSE
jgi:hypothetical protein